MPGIHSREIFEKAVKAGVAKGAMGDAVWWDAGLSLEPQQEPPHSIVPVYTVMISIAGAQIGSRLTATFRISADQFKAAEVEDFVARVIASQQADRSKELSEASQA